MYRHLIKLSLLLALVALLVAGCSKEESSTGPEVTAPTIPTITFAGPNTTSQDVNVAMVKSSVSMMNTFTVLFAQLAAIPVIQNGNVSAWTHVDGTLTVTVTATRQSDGSFLWKMVLNGTNQSDGTVYNNWTSIEGTTSADGKNGDWKLYEENTAVLAFEYIWTTSNNVLTGTLKEYLSSVFESQIVVVNNPDNSGEVRMYEGTVLVYKAVWQANGSGEWWTYYSDGTQSGTWT